MTEFTNVILIPYRNREKHLEIFIKHAIPLFELYLKPFKVVVIEQEEGKLFNRGMLLNIGFNEYKDKTEYLITHDIDIIPNEECVKALYNKSEYDVIRIFNGHDVSLGGITKFKTNSIFEVNGFPNYIWGWGIEDRALYYRYKIKNQLISPNYTNYNNFNHLPHQSNVEHYIGEKLKISNKENDIFQCNNKEIQIEHIMSSGLNNLEYKIINRKNINKNINENIEIIKVSI